MGGPRFIGIYGVFMRLHRFDVKTVLRSFADLHIADCQNVDFQVADIKSLINPS
jgi:hypothetical protein